MIGSQIHLLKCESALVQGQGLRVLDLVILALFLIDSCERGERLYDHAMPLSERLLLYFQHPLE